MMVALTLALSLLTPDSPTPDVRVMSFNIRYATPKDGPNIWENRRDFLAETVNAFAPDLLGTQETLGRQRDDLSQRLPEYDVLAAGRDDGAERGEMMAVFYKKARFEKLAGGHFWLSETPDVPGSKSWDSSLPRMATWIKLKDRHHLGAPPLLMVNTHFDHMGPTSRVEAARLLRRKIDQLAAGSRVILTGDFNSGDGSDPYKIVFSKEPITSLPLVDTFRATHPTRSGDEGTSSNFRVGTPSGARIDWIGVSPTWTIREADILRAQRDGRTPSDHHPVTAVLTFPRA